MVIRYQPRTHSLGLTLPRYVSIRQGLSFVEQRRLWIEKQLHSRPAPQTFSDGLVLSILGEKRIITHSGGRGVVRLTDEALVVPGNPEFLARRVRDFLKSLAKEEITILAHLQASRIDKKIGRISLRDTTSHWGSCNSSGNLSFSWRLVLAPREVLEYVVCHEVAHLKYLNHSQKFWETVEMLYPNHTIPRRWLKQHGDRLYQYH